MTLLRAVKQGKIKPASVTPGGYYRYKEEDLKTYCEETMAKYQAPPQQNQKDG